MNNLICNTETIGVDFKYKGENYHQTLDPYRVWSDSDDLVKIIFVDTKYGENRPFFLQGRTNDFGKIQKTIRDIILPWGFGVYANNKIYKSNSGGEGSMMEYGVHLLNSYLMKNAVRGMLKTVWPISTGNLVGYYNAEGAILSDEPIYI